MNPQTVLRKNDDLLDGDISGETVLMSITTGSYYSLNATGAAIWQHLEQPLSLVELCNRLSQEFEVEPQHCQQSVSQFAQRMIDQQILLIVE